MALFRAEQLRSGDPYELSNGHTVLCMPTGGRGSLATGAGYKALADDPDVEDVGIDTGFSPVSDTMRAPDLSIGKITDAPGWVQGIPELAVEYADTGQDEDELDTKIEDLLAAGTKYIWVVRLNGPRRVEIYEPGQAMCKALPGQELDAPGVISRPIPVEAMYDLDVAGDVNFQHVLRRLTGHENLDAVRGESKAEGKAEGKVEGKAEGKAESILAVFEARGIEMSEDERDRILSCRDLPTLEDWLRRSLSVTSAAEILD